MLATLAYTLFLGKPLIMYGGILTYLLLVLTAIVAVMNTKGNHLIPFKWHHRLAIASIFMATIHGIFGLASYFNF